MFEYSGHQRRGISAGKAKKLDIEIQIGMNIWRNMTGWLPELFNMNMNHLLGKLFVDYLPTLKKQFIKKKLTEISKGNVDADYRMKFSSRR